MIDHRRTIPPSIHGGPSGDGRVPVIDFSTSVNAFGPALHVAEAIRQAPIGDYPDPTSRLVRDAAAAWWERSPDEILFGAGTSELLSSVALALLHPGDAVAIATPTYGEYARASVIAGAQCHEIASHAETPSLDIARIREAIGQYRPSLTFICSPNNPTGELIGAEILAQMADDCAMVGGSLVIDRSYEAFLPHNQQSLPQSLVRHPNVLILRSLTKEHALAGVRAGFLLGEPAVIRQVEQIRTPWSASSFAQAGAIAAFTTVATEHVTRTTAILRQQQQQLAASIKALGVPLIAGTIHTLLARVTDAAGFSARLLKEHSFKVRDCTSFGLPDHIRIAARTPGENQQLLDVFPHVYAAHRADSLATVDA